MSKNESAKAALECIKMLAEQISFGYLGNFKERQEYLCLLSKEKELIDNIIKSSFGANKEQYEDPRVWMG